MAQKIVDGANANGARESILMQFKEDMCELR